MDWLLVIAICNTDESQCWVVSNGDLLWDGTSHGAALVSARYHAASVIEIVASPSSSCALNYYVFVEQLPLRYPAIETIEMATVILTFSLHPQSWVTNAIKTFTPTLTLLHLKANS